MTACPPLWRMFYSLHVSLDVLKVRRRGGLHTLRAYVGLPCAPLCVFVHLTEEGALAFRCSGGVSLSFLG